MIRGSCLCRQVTYQAADLVGPYVYCHCESCRKSNGTAFAANISAPIEGFEVLSGAEQISVYESSPGKRRHFCRTCGSPLYTKVGPNPAVVRLRLGSLDDEFNEKPSAHIFITENPGWHEIADATPQFERWPDPDQLAIPGSRQSEK